MFRFQGLSGFRVQGFGFIFCPGFTELELEVWECWHFFFLLLGFRALGFVLGLCIFSS